VSTAPEPASAPAGLRAVFGLVVLAVAAVCVASALPEWSQLFAALSNDYHAGDPPRADALTASLACVLGALWIARCLVRKGRGMIPAGIAILAGLVLTFVDSRRESPQGRNWAAADKRILEGASAFRERMARRLQHDHLAPTAEAEWDAMLAQAVPDPSPARSRWFSRQPYALVRLASQHAEPAKLRPGMILLWVSDDRTSFELSPIGFNPKGEPAHLWDADGHSLVLTSAFDPFAAATETPP
jgi:hypothetical protein